MWEPGNRVAGLLLAVPVGSLPQVLPLPLSFHSIPPLPVFPSGLAASTSVTAYPPGWVELSLPKAGPFQLARSFKTKQNKKQKPQSRFLGTQEFLMGPPSEGSSRGPSLAYPPSLSPLSSSLNTFVFLEPEGAMVGWSVGGWVGRISRPPIEPAAGLGQAPSLPPAACPVPSEGSQPRAKVWGFGREPV